jgi:CheY-like chemotaxis protein
MDKHNHTILLADDDLDDLNLLTDVLHELDTSYSIVQTHDGEEAIKKLAEMKEAGNLPCLVILDINMPKMDGKQTLVTIQSDSELSDIPVVIFSTSNSEVDKLFFKNKNVEMITKPIEYESLYKVAAQMLTYCNI